MRILFVGNLPEEVDEEIINQRFAKYGRIDQIKITWGRNEDDRKKCKNQANIKFLSFQDAYRAKVETSE